MSQETEGKKSSIQLSRSGQIATVRIGTGKPGNVLDVADLESLRSQLTDVRHDESLRVLIVTGDDDAFSSGADLEAIESLDDQQLGYYVSLGNECATIIDSFPKPVVAAINGRSMGLGCELALSCHFRVAAPRAELVISELGRGMPPVCGFSPRLAELVGSARALELMLRAGAISAERALRLGLVNLVVDAAELSDATMELARDLAQSAPLAMKFALEINRRGGSRGGSHRLHDALLLERERFGECFGTEDMREGVRAFLEKRKPDFKGR